MALSLAVILLNYKRPQNMGAIVNTVREALPVAPIFILDQAEADDFRARSDIPWSEVRFRRSHTNKGAGARVMLASRLPFDLFLSIDDDTFLETLQVKRLSERLLAEPDRAHGLWGERLERDEGEFRLRSGLTYFDGQVSILNQVYAFSRAQARAAIELSRRIGFASWQDVVVGNDILLSCASSKAPLCHNLGPLRVCLTSEDQNIAVSRWKGFRERRAEIARRLVVAKAIGVFPAQPELQGPGLSEPIFDLRTLNKPIGSPAPRRPARARSDVRVEVTATRGLSSRLKHVAWLVNAPVLSQPDGRLTSPQASSRYRCLLPAREIAARGIQCTVYGNIGRIDPATFVAKLTKAQVEIMVAGKPRGPKMVELARLARGQGILLVGDFCDDFFDDPRYGPVSRSLVALSDDLVSSTPVLSQTLERMTGRRATTISDPYEGVQGAAKFSPNGKRLELLWFGHDANYATLAPSIPDLQALSRQHPLRLTIVTAVNRIEPLPVPLSPRFQVDYVAWSLREVWRRLAACDVVIIPTLKTRHYESKSPNRLIESIWAGRAVVAHPIPSYRDFAAFCWLADDFSEAIAEMVADPGAVKRRIVAGQEYVERCHAPAVIADQWIDFLSVASSADHKSPQPDLPILLRD